MLTAKDLLLKQTAEAFKGRPDMPLMASLEGITQAEASWRPDENTPTIEQIVRHVAWAKSRFCARGFVTAMALDDPSVVVAKLPSANIAPWRYSFPKPFPA